MNSFGIVGLLIMSVLVALLLIKIGWVLFMVPVFNLPNLTWTQALGFSLLASIFRSDTSVKKQ
jgi:hypothetical protein